jgi:hypothetical protein
MKAVPDPRDVPEQVRQVIAAIEGPELDLVLVIDTTQSMAHLITTVQKDLVPSLLGEMERFESYRIGVVFFRDYFEEYLTRPYPFQDNVQNVQNIVDRAVARGGRDIPEAVFEGLYAGLIRYDWEAENRRIILIGDAPPHPRPRGNVTPEMVFEAARERNVQITTIMLPHP